MTMKDRWSLIPFLKKLQLLGGVHGKALGFSKYLPLYCLQDTVQIWHEAPVTHHYSCAYSSPKNFIIKSYPYNIQKTDITTSEMRNSDITVSPLPSNSTVVKIHTTQPCI